jgi:hypothetical protein
MLNNKSVSLEEKNMIWKDVVGFEGLYQVSDNGMLRSVDRYVKHFRGGLRMYKGSEKKSRKDGKGYLRTNLKTNGKSFDKRTHVLVCEAFLPNPEGKPIVNHKNGIKDDNRVSNLEWVTYSENVNHALKTGLTPKKLNDAEVLEILSSNDSQRKLGIKYNVSASIIHKIKKGTAYKHIEM